jgi:hypothetical protein
VASTATRRALPPTSHLLDTGERFLSNIAKGTYEKRMATPATQFGFKIDMFAKD